MDFEKAVISSAIKDVFGDIGYIQDVIFTYAAKSSTNRFKFCK